MSRVQSVLISRKKFPNIFDAEEKILHMGFKLRKVDATNKFYRFRQFNPDKSKKYRTKKINSGITLILEI